MKPFVLCSFLVALLSVPVSAHAAVVINEIAWPRTNFVIVLSGVLLCSAYFFVRTKGSQSWCLGKPSTNIFHEKMLVLGKMGTAVLLLLPGTVHGAVTINEIAWMGTENSANDEWIELHNSSTGPVSLDGWTLTDQDDLSIELSGELAAGEYAVLERTDDTSAPGTAFLIYTGALANTGATLVLRDDGGATQDQVAGGENWEAIGGNNDTKDTAQYSAQGWITAVPTPGAENATEPSPTPATEDPETEKSETESTRNSSGAGPAPVKEAEHPRTLVPSTKQLALSVTAPEVIYVNQPATFVAEPGNIGETIMDSLQYEWNFGDLHTATGKTVTHTYAYPGQYLLTLRATYARHDEIYQKEVTVLPVKFSLTQNSDGDLQVHNNSPYEVDVSGFTLAGEQSVTFPPLSFIPQNGTVTIPQERITGLRHGQAQLFDTRGTMLTVLTSMDADPEVPRPAPVQYVATARTSPAPANAVATTAAATSSNFAFASRPATSASSTATGTVLDPSEPAVLTRATGTALTAAAPATGQSLPEASWPLLGLVGVIGLGLAGVYLGSQKAH